MESSIYLAKVIGLYFTITSIAVLIFKDHFKKIFKEGIAHPFFVTFSGFLSLVLGLLIVIAHNYWLGDWTTAITVFGWLLLFQGFMRVYFPSHAIRWVKQITQSKSGLLWMGWIFLIFGIYLAYMGFSFVNTTL